MATVGERTAYVGSQRDREVVEVNLVEARVERRIPVGTQPAALVANRAGTRLTRADAGPTRSVPVDPWGRRELTRVPTAAPAESIPPDVLRLRGSNPNALALSPDERTLYVTNGGNSTLAVIELYPKAATPGR